MTASLEDVAAVVLASRGGARLASALDGVAWAGERIVLDPAGRLGAALSPPIRSEPPQIDRASTYSRLRLGMAASHQSTPHFL